MTKVAVALALCDGDQTKAPLAAEAELRRQGARRLQNTKNKSNTYVTSLVLVWFAGDGICRQPRISWKQDRERRAPSENWRVR
jgi:hypothetical protein